MSKKFYLKDWHGKEKEFTDEKIFVRGEDGELIQFTQGTGGGSSADLRYVTFMNHDGTVEYGKKAVAVGDDCADPIARGIFATPTRESDAQYDYTFYGWATAPNGAADSNALKAVNEDKVVYANFAAAVRYYIARFYDGDTLLAEIPTAYGTQAVPPNVSAKDGYIFTGWNPNELTIYNDTDFSAVWAEMKGYYYITTISGLANGDLLDMAINNDGSHIVVGSRFGDGTGHPEIYDITGNEPVRIVPQSGSPNELRSVDYNSTETKLYGSVYKSNGNGTANLYRVPINVTGNIYEYSAMETVASNKNNAQTIMRCSPVNDNHMVVGSGDRGVSTAIIFITSGGISGRTVTITNDSTIEVAYSQDGEYVAVASSANGAKIYKADGTYINKVATDITGYTSVSFSGDGKLIAVSGYNHVFRVYDVETGSVAFDFTDIFEKSGKCEFMYGTNELVLVTVGAVRVFDLSASEPTEVANVPTYQGGAITKLRCNRSGTRLGIMSDSGDTIEIWGRV